MNERLAESHKALENQQTLKALSEKRLLALEDKRKGRRFGKKLMNNVDKKRAS
ncbi:MAG: hypothetical protein FWG91_13870 [Lachnospiraceae bacterium]|nr:hypothetical protein [Lachnospiraceae bacterium]